jgi:hypothetical protein
LKIVQNTPNLEMVHSSGGEYFIFENLEFKGQMFATSAPSLAFGNLGLLNDMATEQTLPALVYGYGLTPGILSSTKNSLNGIVFQDNSFLDYVFQTIDNRHLLALASHVRSDLNNPEESWILSTAYPRPICDVYSVGEFYSPSGFAFTKGKNVGLNLQYNNTVGGEQLIWVRSAESPAAGNLQISVDSTVFPELSLNSQQFQGFQWHFVGDLSIEAGVHDLSIRSINGTNLVDKIAIIPTSLFNLRYNECVNYLENSFVSFVIDSSSFTDISGFNSVPYEPAALKYIGLTEKTNDVTSVASLNLTVPFSSSFDLFLHAQATSENARLKISIADNTFTASVPQSIEESDGIMQFGSIQLDKGVYTIAIQPENTFDGNLTFFNLQLVKSSLKSSNNQVRLLQPNFDSYTHATIPFNNPQQAFIVYSSAYDSGWNLQANAGRLALHVETNGFSNGWFISEANSTDGEQPLDLSFGSQMLLNISSAASIILIITIAVASILTLVWFRRK